MCGFAGIVELSGRPADRQAIDKMTRSITHRGPDQEGVFLEKGIGLGFRRLSILDLSELGSQPMHSPDGRTVIVYNGEIYNYVELRKELEELGHGFRSTGDTEVLLAAYREWGRECLNRLNGMWAFLIYDRVERTVFGARDRFGIKPLYFSELPDRTLFGSEIKAIRASGYCNASPNWRLSASYLLEGRLSEPDSANETLYEGINELPAGSAFLCGADGKIRQWSFWDLRASGELSNLEEANEQFLGLFEDSVRLRMRSDVPVGVCLSGGLDSTSIICSMARRNSAVSNSVSGALKAFSFMDDEFDESEQITATVAQTNAELHRLALEPDDYWERLADVMHFQDEPVHSMNVVISFELYRMAAENDVKVILNGQGADETLAGYPSYFGDFWKTLLTRGRIQRCWQEIRSFCDTHGGDPRRMLASQVRSSLQHQLSRSSAYRSLSLWRRRRNTESNTWYVPDVIDELALEPTGFESLDLTHQLQKSVEISPLPLYLRVEDRNSMAHSVETRLPFLDYRLVELAFRLADDLKMQGPWNKYVLRESMTGQIPDVVRTKPTKLGFPVPQSRWFAGPLSGNILDLLSSPAAMSRGIYNIDAIKSDISAFQKGRIDISPELFRFVQFELFCRHIESTT